MRRDAEKAWRNWNPLIWGVIRYRGCFGEPPKAEPVTTAAPRRRSLLQKFSRCTAERIRRDGTAVGFARSPSERVEPRQGESAMALATLHLAAIPVVAGLLAGSGAVARLRGVAGADRASRSSPLPLRPIASQAGLPCAAQAWPYIDQKCMPSASDQKRTVRLVSAPRGGEAGEADASAPVSSGASAASRARGRAGPDHERHRAAATAAAGDARIFSRSRRRRSRAPTRRDAPAA